MKCDYEALITHANNLNKKFNLLALEMVNIEEYNKKMTNTNTWDSETRDYYNELFNKLKENFEVFSDKCTNISNYLDNVISNYKSLDDKNFF